jgi:hypothetical protein
MPVVLKEFFKQLIIPAGFIHRGNTSYCIQTITGKATVPVYISTQKTAAAPGADKDLQGYTNCFAGRFLPGPLDLKLHRFSLVHGVQKRIEDLVLQRVNEEAVFYPEGLVVMVKLIGQHISDNAEISRHLIERKGIQDHFAGLDPESQGIVQGEDDPFPLRLSSSPSFA